MPAKAGFYWNLDPSQGTEANKTRPAIVVSNDAVRDSVARACEALGVPWYGPTFDS